MKRSPMQRTPVPWDDKRQERKQRADDPISDETRAVVRKRSAGLCELGCGQPGSHYHHRQLRRAGDHLPANIVHLCGPCHTRVHGHVRWSLDTGWIVSQYGDARTVEILRHNDWVLLTDSGTLVAK